MDEDRIGGPPGGPPPQDLQQLIDDFVAGLGEPPAGGDPHAALLAAIAKFKTAPELAGLSLSVHFGDQDPEQPHGACGWWFLGCWFCLARPPHWPFDREN